jgi:predicted nucleotidyltransferase
MQTLTKPTTSNLILELGAVNKKFNSLFGILIVGLIGSRARGDITELSDVDVAVRRQRRIGFLTVVRAKDWLAERIGSDVDLVSFESFPERKKVVFLQDMREIA